MLNDYVAQWIVDVTREIADKHQIEFDKKGIYRDLDELYPNWNEFVDDLKATIVERSDGQMIDVEVMIGTQDKKPNVRVMATWAGTGDVGLLR